MAQALMAARRVLCSAARPLLASSARALPVAPAFRRTMGGGHEHSHEHDDGHNGWLFGEDPSKPRAWESWEAPYYIAMGSAVTILYVGMSYKPKTSIKVWAMDRVRERREAGQ